MNQTITGAKTDQELVVSWLHSKPSKLTRHRYLKNYEQFIKFAEVSIGEAKVEQIQDFLRMLEMKGYKPATISQKLSSIKSLFTYAVTVGYISISPCVVVKSPMVHNQISTKLLTLDDVKLLVEGAKNERDRLMIKLLFGLGLRVSELVKIRWDDFYVLGSGEVKVRIIGKGD